MTTLCFGNSNPQMQLRVPAPGATPEMLADGTGYTHFGAPATHLTVSKTNVAMWDGFDDKPFVEHTLSTDNDRMLSLIARSLPSDFKHYAVGVQELEHVVERHTGGSKPDWIVCSDQLFGDLLANHFGCAHFPADPTLQITNVGRDALHDQHLKVGSQPGAFNQMALTASTTTPATSDTTLAAEIVTAGGGLLRGTATYAHTVGTNTSTLTKTFTANGSDALPVVLAQIGIFNASGTLGYHTALTSTATLTVSGDSTTITWTDTGG